jgi:hypothetical protein
VSDLATVKVRIMHYSDILRCPHVIMLPEHYRADGTCKCDDPAERRRMRSWGYHAKDFAGVSLRKDGAK